MDNNECNDEWDFKNLSLPHLQILRAKNVSIESLTSLIESTSGFLVEIKIDYIYHYEKENKRIIQAIYHKCPILKYLKLVFRNCNILELEKLLNNCQYLKVLFILICDSEFDWNNLFEILINSSPSSYWNNNKQKKEFFFSLSFIDQSKFYRLT